MSSKEHRPEETRRVEGMPAERVHEQEPEGDRRRADQSGDGPIGEQEPTVGSFERTCAGWIRSAIGMVAQADSRVAEVYRENGS